MSEQPTEYGKELIEAMALAIWRAREIGFPPRVRRFNPDDFDRESGAWRAVVLEARAALLAACAKLKEPSEVMADKGESSLICGPEPKDIEGSPSMSWAHAKSCFRAMLSQLLTEIGSPT